MSEKKKAKIKINTDYKTKYGFSVPENYVFKTQKGLNEKIITQISEMKKEPEWMKEFRLKAYKIFKEKPIPQWGGNLNNIDFDNIYYYIKPTQDQKRSWDDVPTEIKETFDRLGIPQAERKHLAGVKAQFESEVVYGSLLKELEEEGVIFLDTDTALKKHPRFFEEYFGKVIPPNDNKFAALNSAVWSGGSFVYIPKGVHVKRPLQAYFRINAMNMGQFERTLIIADEGSYGHYVEGCFTKGHKITTNPDYKSIEDIKVGDKVLTHTGEYKEVYHIQERPYTGNLYKIKVWGLPDVDIEVTEEHPFLCMRNEHQEWTAAKDLHEGALLCVPTEEVNRKGNNVLDTKRLDKNYAYVQIQQIQKREVENIPVYNFSVEDDESYVVNSVAVHNCTAPVYSSDSLHAAVVEVIVKKGARFRYTTIQNWSYDVYNLVTKRARVEEDAIMDWVDGNLGSKLTMKYPSCYLVGKNAHGEVLSIAYAGSEKQHQDAGAKMIHIAPNTTSTIISKSISANGGRTSYRGMVAVTPSAKNAKSRVECDALILDSESRSDTFPVMKIDESSANIEHEATVSKIGEEKLFYLMSRGLTEPEAMGLIVSGFIEPIVKELPLEYAVELNRLIELEMEGSVG